ncbi:MAG: hypothetical protein PWQ60_2455 [Thermoanaerobacteraceae bacterium]|jgi:hypothetical protein|nr:hypothetical protein [Thermoanaerobacteraceae bacterium]
MKVSIKNLTIIILIVFFGGIAISNFLGVWKTESSKIPGKIKSGESVGENNPMDIKGSFTFNDISKSFNIPIEDLASAFLVPIEKANEFKCKDLENKYTDTQGKEIGTGSVRMFVAFYKGIKIDLIEETFIPNVAAEIINKRGTPLEEQKNYMLKHTVDVK